MLRTLTEVHLVNEIAGHNANSKQKSVGVVESIQEIVKGNLAHSEDVLISNFGKFCVKEKRKRRGRNPATGDNLMITPRKVITFRCSGKLRDRINGRK